MTVVDPASNPSVNQAPYDFSLTHASDLLEQMNDIQNFLTSSAISELNIDVPLLLQDRQSQLLSEISMIVHQQSNFKND